jgi:prevent-host-death family protein
MRGVLPCSIVLCERHKPGGGTLARRDGRGRGRLAKLFKSAILDKAIKEPYPMHTVRASDAKNRFSELVDRVQREPVRIERHGRGVAVLMSEAEYAEVEQLRLDALRAKIDRGIADFEAGRTFSHEEVFAQIYHEIDKG